MFLTITVIDEFFNIKLLNDAMSDYAVIQRGMIEQWILQRNTLPKGGHVFVGIMSTFS